MFNLGGYFTINMFTFLGYSSIKMFNLCGYFTVKMFNLCGYFNINMFNLCGYFASIWDTDTARGRGPHPEGDRCVAAGLSHAITSVPDQLTLC